MTDHVESFIAAMRAAGCGPESVADIIADDKWRPYRLEGDRPGKKVGYARFKVDGDFAVGNFGSHREGVTHNWHAKLNGKDYTEEEKLAYKAAVDAQKSKQVADRKAAEQAAQAEAKAIWDKSTLASAEHPYLARKKIQAHNARLHEGKLLVMMVAEKKFEGFQSIDEEGDKLFNDGIKGGRVKGCYLPLTTKDDPKDVFIICEGFATGATIREATKLPTICAFTAGNLQPVAEYFKAQYPDSTFIFCADNDAWQKLKPTDDERVYVGVESDKNTGIQKAQQAAAKIGGAPVIWPEFPDDCRDTDFNDLYLRDGLEAVAERISSMRQNPKPAKPIAIAKPEDWTSGLLVKRVSKDNTEIWLEENSVNYSRIVKSQPRLKGLFAWDEFHLCTMLVNPPPWVVDTGRADDFKVHELDEPDIRECDYFIQNLGFHLRGSMDKTRGAIDDAALMNKIHPARDYFNSLEWDMKPRLDNWLIDYCGCKRDDADYVRTVGRTWMIAAVKRVFEPGCKFDHMLILEGPQAAGKSTALKLLATFGDGAAARSYFMDTLKISNCEDPDELMKLTGSIIVEIQEMSGFNKKDDDALKAFITTTEDAYRAPYGRKVKKWPRQFVLAGTYNPLDGIFKDPTGLRRFWVVATGPKIDLARLRDDRKQLWAEAVYRYKSGESLVLSPEIYKKAEEAAGQRRIVSDMTVDVLKAVRGLPFFEVRDVLKTLEIPVKGKSQQESREISKILMVEGFERARRRVGNRQVYCWSPPGGAEEIQYSFVEDEEINIDF